MNLIHYLLNWVLLQQNPVRRPLQHQHQKVLFKHSLVLIQQSDRRKNITTKGKQPIVDTEYEETKSDGSEDSDESDEEFDAEEEPEEKDEEVHAKTTSKPSTATKDKGKGI